MKRGFSYNPKPKEAKPAQHDLSSTSGAKRALHDVRRGGSAEDIASIEKQVSESHPDILIDRRR